MDFPRTRNNPVTFSFTHNISQRQFQQTCGSAKPIFRSSIDYSKRFPSLSDMLIRNTKLKPIDYRKLDCCAENSWSVYPSDRLRALMPSRKMSQEVQKMLCPGHPNTLGHVHLLLLVEYTVASTHLTRTCPHCEKHTRLTRLMRNLICCPPPGPGEVPTTH